jgi:hypothetical protein
MFHATCPTHKANSLKLPFSTVYSHHSTLKRQDETQFPFTDFSSCFQPRRTNYRYCDQLLNALGVPKKYHYRVIALNDYQNGKPDASVRDLLQGEV